MLRPHRFDEEVDPGPVQIHARKVHFDVSGIGLHWIPGHPVASNVISLLNVVLPAGSWELKARYVSVAGITYPQVLDAATVTTTVGRPASPMPAPLPPPASEPAPRPATRPTAGGL